MSPTRQWLVIAGTIAVLGAGLAVAVTRLGTELFPIKIGSKAPDFTAYALAAASDVTSGEHGAHAGAPKGIADYRGEVVLLNIWATWCEPCRVEMPSIERLQQRLGPKGLRIVSVSVDDPGMEARIRAFVAEYALTFEILHDAPGTIRDQYQTTGVPETFVIGRDGRVRRRIIGQDDWSSAPNIAFLERLLGEPAP